VAETAKEVDQSQRPEPLPPQNRTPHRAGGM
jgi:hypothetical protein